MQEVAFVAEVSKWVDRHLAGHRGLPFTQSGIEGQSVKSAQRRDFTLRDEAGQVVLTGEVKLPFARDGRTPHATAVVRDARGKARRAGAKWFFTWNVNRFVLWETDPPHRTPADAPPGHPAADPFRAWDLPGVSVAKAADLDSPIVQDRIQNWLPVFLEEFARIYRGAEDLDRRTPDERFVDQLEAALDAPIRSTVAELAARYRKKPEAARLNKWMREDLGWTISKDERDLPDLLDRAARFSCYVLVNRLVFYEALLKRYGSQLDRLDVPAHVDTGERLRGHLEAAFRNARDVTRDYETVFGDDPANVGNRVPFYSDAAVAAWRDLIADVHRFDFSKLDYDVIGTLFERLIDPAERHRYGQYYTRPEVVDLLNAFAIRTPDAAVMDPACGGGTFLVRAYARKRELALAAGGRTHAELLGDLYGVDVSHFAAHLTTINLATRDLIEDENYPRVARNDFFDVAPGSRFMDLPAALDAGGLGSGQRRTVEIPPLDAVVGNPPYVRQEDVPKGAKTKYRDLAKDYGAKLNARSDLHAYFWPHAAAFLKPDGWLCLLTASQWLDTEYGFKLQEWILRHFTIHAVFESPAEPWFVGARVVTTATVLRREPDEAARMTHRAKFVQLRVPLADLLTHDGTNAGAIQAADEFRDEIEALTASTVTDGYRARVVIQGDIWRDGVRLAEASGKADKSSSTHTHTHTHTHTRSSIAALRRRQVGRPVAGPGPVVRVDRPPRRPDRSALGPRPHLAGRDDRLR